MNKKRNKPTKYCKEHKIHYDKKIFNGQCPECREEGKPSAFITIFKMFFGFMALTGFIHFTKDFIESSPTLKMMGTVIVIAWALYPNIEFIYWEQAEKPSKEKLSMGYLVGIIFFFMIAMAITNMELENEINALEKEKTINNNAHEEEISSLTKATNKEGIYQCEEICLKKWEYEHGPTIGVNKELKYDCFRKCFEKLATQ